MAVDGTSYKEVDTPPPGGAEYHDGAATESGIRIAACVLLL